MAEHHVELVFEVLAHWPCGCPVTAEHRHHWRAASALRMADELTVGAMRALEALKPGTAESRFAAFMVAAGTDARVRAIFLEAPPWVGRVH